MLNHENESINLNLTRNVHEPNFSTRWKHDFIHPKIKTNDLKELLNILPLKLETH